MRNLFTQTVFIPFCVNNFPSDTFEKAITQLKEQKSISGTIARNVLADSYQSLTKTRREYLNKFKLASDGYVDGD